jgi:hypothetical protein
MLKKLSFDGSKGVSLLGFLFEDVYSDLVKKNPELEEPLKKAKEVFGPKLSGKYLPWLGKILVNNPGEPVEDIIPLVLGFEKNLPAIKAAGGSPDINSYKTTGDLSRTLESLDRKRQEKNAKEQEKIGGFRQHLLSTMDVVYASDKPEVDPWIIVMPRTTQESCEAGVNTTWCTARTKSQNLFLNYVGRGKDIILFYVINPAEDPRKNPNAKLSIGYVGGKVQLKGQNGHVSVNANNDGLTPEKFSQIVGPQRASVFLNLMDQKAKSLGGVHPAQKEVINILKNPDELQKKLESFKEDDAREDFSKLVLDVLNEDRDKAVIPRVLEIIFSMNPQFGMGHFPGSLKQTADENIQEFIFRRFPEILIKNHNIEERFWKIFIKNAKEISDFVLLLENNKLTEQEYNWTFEKTKSMNYSNAEDLYDALVKHPFVTFEIAEFLLKHSYFSFKLFNLVLENKSLKEYREPLLELMTDFYLKNYDLALYRVFSLNLRFSFNEDSMLKILTHPKAKLEYKQEFALKRGMYIKNTNLLNYLLSLGDSEINNSLLGNPLVGKDFLISNSQNPNLNAEQIQNLINNTNIPINLLFSFTNSKDQHVRRLAWDRINELLSQENYQSIKNYYESGASEEQFSFNPEELSGQEFETIPIPKRDKIILIRFIENEKTLEELSFSQDEDFRWAVASNINTPTNTLLNLSSPKFEKSKFVRNQAIKTLRADDMLEEAKKFLVKSFIFKK